MKLTSLIGVLTVWTMLASSECLLAQSPPTIPPGKSKLFEDLGQDEPGATDTVVSGAKPEVASPKPAVATGRSVVFLCDVSESIEVAAAVQRESTRAITNLPAGYQFRMLATKNGAVISPSEALTPIGEGKGDAARTAALKFAAEVAPATQSELIRLLPVGMKPQPNLLYLMIDRKSDLSRAYALLATLNADKRTKVNVILYVDGQIDSNLYNSALAIARDHGGTYRRDYVKESPADTSVAAGKPNPGATITPPVVQRTPPPIADGQAVNLLPLIDLDHDVIDGVWSNKTGQLICVSGNGPKLRLPFKPPPQFDLVVEFTATVSSDYNAVAILATDQLSSYGFFVGTGQNNVAGFGNINGTFPKDNPSSYRAPNLIEANRRYKATLKVRTDGITGWLDERLLAELPVSSTGLALDRNWRVGCNTIGIGTSRKAIFHSIQIIGHQGRGEPVIRAQTRKQANLLPFNPAKTISLTDREPIAVQTGWDRLRINDNPDKHVVEVRGKPCDRYLFAHAPSSLLYQVPEGAVAFRAVGVKPAGKFNQKDGEFRYFVYIDGNEAFISSSINNSNGTVSIDVPIPKSAKRIELRVDKLGTDYRDHAIWAQPEFLMPR